MEFEKLRDQRHIKLLEYKLHQKSTSRLETSNKITSIATSICLVLLTVIGLFISWQNSINSTRQLSSMEADRNGEKIVLLNSIQEQIHIEISKSETNRISNSTIARVVSLSHSFSPYRLLDLDKTLQEPISPERGRLLQYLADSEVNTKDLDKIFHKANFSYSNLKNAEISNLNLSKVDLSFSDFTGVNMFNVQFEECMLEDVVFDESTFHDCKFTKAHFLSDIANSNFYQSDFLEAQFHDSSFNNCDFSETILSNSVGAYAAFDRCNFTGSDLEEVIATMERKDNYKPQRKGPLRTSPTCNCGKSSSLFKEINASHSYKINIDNIILDKKDRLAAIPTLDQNYIMKPLDNDFNVYMLKP